MRMVRTGAGFMGGGKENVNEVGGGDDGFKLGWHGDTELAQTVEQQVAQGVDELLGPQVLIVQLEPQLALVAHRAGEVVEQFGSVVLASGNDAETIDEIKHVLAFEAGSLAQRNLAALVDGGNSGERSGPAGADLLKRFGAEVERGHTDSPAQRR
jgi:hypothetical protein